MDSVQKANGEKATAGEGCGWAGGRGYCGMEGGGPVGRDHSDGFGVFVSCMKPAPKQNRMHLLTN